MIDDELARMGDSNTLETICALGADGAFKKALKQLDFEEMLDANVPEVVIQLMALHQTGPPTMQPVRMRSYRRQGLGIGRIRLS